VDYDGKKAAADIKNLLEGKPADILGKCVTCCACREYCPTGADPFDLILKAMEKYSSYNSPDSLKMFSLAPLCPAR